MTVGDVAKVGGVVEARVEVGQAERFATVGVDREQVAQRAALVGGAERGALDDRVGGLAAEPATLDERAEDAAAGVQPEAALDVLEHPLAADDEALDEPGHLHEQVVEQDRRVGQDHPLGRGVADVALVPQRLVLERRLGVAAEQAGEAGDPLRRGSGCACGASPIEPFWPALNGSMTSPISVCWRFRISVANRSRLPPRIAIAVRSAACRSRWTIWVLDRVGVEVELGEDLGLDVRPEVAVRADRARRSCRSRSRRRRPRGGAGRGRPRTPSRRA